jgi:EmrB/QacA subfamily drug resistance transporter
MATTSAPRPRGSTAVDVGGRYRWVAMAVVLIGSYMVILDSTIVNVALPQIGIDLHQGTGIEWIVTAYLLAVGASQPITGWLADRFGRKLIFTCSIASFGTGSLLAALSPNLSVLVLFRVLQGLGGGAMMPVGMTMIYELFPAHQRGTALGIWGVSTMAAPAVGPVLGGYLVTVASWRWLFLINVPIGVIGFFAAIKLLRDFGYRERRAFDGTGFALASTGLVALLLAFSEAGSWGWTAPQTLALIGVGSVLLACFVVHALRARAPLIAVQMFAIPTFSTTIVIVCLLTVSQFGRLVFIPLELETLRHFSAFKTGLILTPSALGAALTNPLGGRLADKIGARVPVTIGTAIVALAALLLARLTPTTTITYMVVVLAIQGLGNGLAIMPNTVAAMNSLTGNLVAQGSAVRSLMRQVAGSLGVGILASVVAAQVGTGAVSLLRSQNAYDSVFYIAFGATLVALTLAFTLPGPKGMRALQEARAAEDYARMETGE